MVLSISANVNDLTTIFSGNNTSLVVLTQVSENRNDLIETEYVCSFSKRRTCISKKIWTDK